MPRTNHMTTWATGALLAAGVALPGGFVLALDHPHEDDEKSEREIIVRAEKGDKAHAHRKHRSHGSWSDGDVEVTTTVEDGHVKVIVNGDVVYDGDISQIADIDLGEIKLRKLDGALALLKDGDQVMRLGGDGPIIIGDEELALEHLQKLRLEGLEALEGLRHLDFEGDWSFAFDHDHLKEMLDKARRSRGQGQNWSFDVDSDKIEQLVKRFSDQGGAFAFSQDGEHPPVMLGINIGTGDEVVAKLEQLNLEPDEVTVVVRPIEGLPAARSGVKSGDVIIELEGSKSAGHGVLTEVLKGKKVGETIELKVLRDNKVEEIIVELETYDRAKLGLQPPAEAYRVRPDTMRFAPQWRGLQYSNAELGELAAQISKLAAEMADANKAKREALAEKLEKLTAELSAKSLKGLEGMQDFSFGQGQNNQWRFKTDEGEAFDFKFKALPRIEIEGDGRGWVIVTPDAEEDESDEGDSGNLNENQRRIRELEAKIKRLERLLQERERDGDV